MIQHQQTEQVWTSNSASCCLQFGNGGVPLIKLHLTLLCTKYYLMYSVIELKQAYLDKTQLTEYLWDPKEKKLFNSHKK